MQEYLDNKIEEISNSLKKEYYISVNMRVCADYFVHASSEEEARKIGQFEFETQDLNLPENLEIVECDRESEFHVEICD